MVDLRSSYMCWERIDDIVPALVSTLETYCIKLGLGSYSINSKFGCVEKWSRLEV
jgi:hypothetical protein